MWSSDRSAPTGVIEPSFSSLSPSLLLGVPPSTEDDRASEWFETVEEASEAAADEVDERLGEFSSEPLPMATSDRMDRAATER